MSKGESSLITLKLINVYMLLKVVILNVYLILNFSDSQSMDVNSFSIKLRLHLEKENLIYYFCLDLIS